MERVLTISTSLSPRQRRVLGSRAIYHTRVNSGSLQLHCLAAVPGDDDGHTPPRERHFQEFRETEEHPSYQREDLSEEHSRLARLAFLKAIAQGDGAMDLAEAALQIAAEDDALVSHSAVQFPVASFRRRLQNLADELTRVVLPPLRDSGASNETILEAIVQFMYVQQRFQPPRWGRSALFGPNRSVVDHPGVWESPKLAYLNEVLITKRGIPAALAIVLSDIMRRLLIAGAIDFVARVECSAMDTAPAATLIPGITRDMAFIDVESSSRTISTTRTDTKEESSGPVALNMCTVDALAECLTYLKRAYWPFKWDSAAGGFRAAARSFLDGADSAEAEAIARTARHRLERGIWTSPGAGDLRRAVAAAERLVILRGDTVLEERRDLAVLYCHAGKLAEARAELKAYSAAIVAGAGTSSSIRNLAGGGGQSQLQIKRPLTISLTPVGISVAGSPEELPDAVLADRLLALLGQIPMGREKAVALSYEEAVRRCSEQGPKRVLPLTW